MKYIIFDDNGLDVPVIFPPQWDHARTAQRFHGKTILSAGFVEMGDGGEIVARGASKSLNVGSRPEDTETIIRALKFRL
jgi:hypothetical protein